jgi:predicted nucleic acid-binding protein
MSQYLLDTNHLSPLVTIGHPLQVKILAALQSGDDFAIASPVLNEFIFGISSIARAQQNLTVWNKLKNDFTYYAVDEVDAEVAANLRIALRRNGRQVALVDSFVAVIARRYNLTLLTTDKDFFAIEGLDQENWR